MALPEYKDIVDLIKKGATVEAQERIMELRQAVLTLKEENLALRQRVTELENKLGAATEMNFNKPFYFKMGDDQPFCPLCWEKDKLAIHLIGPYEAADGTYYRCEHCETPYEIKERPPWRVKFVRG